MCVKNKYAIIDVSCARFNVFNFIKAIKPNSVCVRKNANKAKLFTSKRNAKRYIKKHAPILTQCKIYFIK